MTLSRSFLTVLCAASLCAAAETDFMELQHRAAGGDGAAMLALGEMFLTGDSVAKDESQAAGWFRRGAEAGYAPAEARLGWMLWKGRGGPRDDGEAETWLRKAVAQGEPSAQESLAQLLSGGAPGASVADDLALGARFAAAAVHRSLRSALPPPSLQDRPTGFRGGMDESKWFFRAAEQGNPAGLRNLGLLYFLGDSVKHDEAEGFRRLLAAADKKDTVARWAVGVLLLDGRGAPKDEAQAAVRFRQAADAGDALAQRALGWMNETGRGMAVNVKEAARLYGLAVQQGDAWSRDALGRLTQDGRGTAKKPDQALLLYKAAEDFPPALVDLGLMLEEKGDLLQAQSCYRRAADAGDAAGRYHLGVLFETGRGGRRDPSESIKLYDLAAYAGVMDAQVRRARLLETGTGAPKDAAKAAALYQSAVDDARAPLAALALGAMKWANKDAAGALALWKPLAAAGDPLAGFWCGRALEKTDRAGAAAFYRAAAQAGDARAQSRLGFLLAEGSSADPKESVLWLTKAADQGDVAAAVRLARRAAGTKDAGPALLRAARLGDRASQAEYAKRSLDGDGVAEDPVQAAVWFRMAAVQGDNASAHALGNLFLAGEGVRLDPAEAARWFGRAANGGFAPAQRDLAMLYEKGLGVSRDAAKAASWYKKAAAAGDAYSLKKTTPSPKR
jgi:TPR repeat protein